MRKAWLQSLRLRFDPRFALRMKAGCNGGGAFALRARSADTAFLLEPASVGACGLLQPAAR